MQCPICGEPTQVERSRASDTRVVRRRVCVADSHHRFETVERLSGADLSRVLVRRSGDGTLAGPVDVDRLVRNLRRATLKRLDDEGTERIVDAALREVATNLADLSRPLPEQERDANPGRDHWISDTAIREAVERQLRAEHDNVSHVLYALSTHGRSAGAGRAGWQSSEDVLAWMDQPQNYPDLSAPAKRPTFDITTDTWHPVGAAPRPSRVIKRSGQRRTFRTAQFVESIEIATMGRPWSRQGARYIVEWILWGLAGQDEVLTSQLAVGAMDCLRRVDDIAYLRWTTIAKNFDSVIDFRTEAVGLVEQPSPKLILDFVGSRFRRTDTTAETPGQPPTQG